MVFVKKSDAVNSKGVLKKGVSQITTKNGQVRYVSSAVAKKDDVKPKVKKVETKEAKTKGVAQEKEKKPAKKIVEAKPKKKKEEEEPLKVEFD